MADPLRITVWNEFHHEQHAPNVKEIYPEGIHTAIADHLKKNRDWQVRTAHLNEEEQGLSDDVINSTDVLIWWAHLKHGEVRDDIVDKLHKRVLSGMGFVALHSTHFAKLFRKLMGTSCVLKWRAVGERARHWVVMPQHPIADGIEKCIEIEHAEMYGEVFDVPPPDELVFIGWFQGGEVFRSGCCYQRGNGRIFYFQPGHETFPIYYQEDVLKVIENAVKWAAPANVAPRTCDKVAPLEPGVPTMKEE